MAAYANKLVDDVYNDGAKGNMVLLQVTDQRKWYISTDSKLKDITGTNDAVNYMSKAFVSYLSNGDYANATRFMQLRPMICWIITQKMASPLKKKNLFLTSLPLSSHSLVRLSLLSPFVKACLIP